jgi:hypothetical protein
MGESGIAPVLGHDRPIDGERALTRNRYRCDAISHAMTVSGNAGGTSIWDDSD